MDLKSAKQFTKIITVQVVLLLFFLAGLGACSQQELVTGVDAKQSVEILVVLNKAGISAVRERTQEGANEKYLVRVTEDDFMKALQVLHDYGLPRNNSETIEALIKPQAFAPQTPAMLALRRDMALSAQVENLLLALPGVVDVRVVVRSDQKSLGLSANDATIAKATVVIRYISDAEQPKFSTDEIKQILVQAVSGLEKDNVGVTLTRVLPGIIGSSIGVADEHYITIPPFRFRVMDADLMLAKRQLFGALIMILLVGGLAGIIVHKMVAKLSKDKRSNVQPVAGLEHNIVVETAPNKLISRKPTLMITSKEDKPTNTN